MGCGSAELILLGDGCGACASYGLFPFSLY